MRKPLAILAAIGALALTAACVTKSYELCDEPGCGDPVNVIVTE